jgi:hypothetical protein
VKVLKPDRAAHGGYGGAGARDCTWIRVPVIARRFAADMGAVALPGLRGLTRAFFYVN